MPPTKPALAPAASPMRPPWASTSVGSAWLVKVWSARNKVTSRCSTSALMPSRIMVAMPIAPAMVDSVAASGVATPTVSTVMIHIAIEIAPITPAITLSTAVAMPMISDTAAMLLASCS